MTQDLILFSGTANPALAAAVAAELGLRLGGCTATRFPDVETALHIDASVRGRDVFVTDSVAADRSWPRLRVVPIAPLIAEAIRRLHAGGSLGNLFQEARALSAPLPHPNEKGRTPC